MSTDSSQYSLTGQSGTGSLTKSQQPLYEYYMVQIPSNFMMSANQARGNEIAAYVQEYANRVSASGWEFYRIDTMGMTVNPGCLDSLFGGKPSHIQYSVMTFRRLR